MSDQPEISDILRPAFESFSEELGKDLIFIRKFLEQSAAQPNLSGDVDKLTQCFHRIKGGAGFLKLKTCYTLASEAELHYQSLLKTLSLQADLEFSEAERKHLEDIFKVLSTEHAELDERLST